MAAAAGHLSVVKLLLADARVNPAAGGQAALCSAAERGDLEMLDLLLADARVSPRANASKSLTAAAEHGRVRVAERLLADGRVDPGADDHKALCAAAGNGHSAVVDLLLPFADSAGVNLALRTASHAGELAAVEQLLVHPLADPSADRNAAVLRAAEEGHVDVLARLVGDPRVILSRPSDANAVLLAACRAGDVALVDVLLRDPRVRIAAPCERDAGAGELSDGLSDSAGASIDSEDPSLLPLAVACEEGHVHVAARLLADSRFDPAACEHAALCAACLHGHAPIVELILAHPMHLVDSGAIAAARAALPSAAAGGSVHVFDMLLARADLGVGMAAAESGPDAILSELMAQVGNAAVTNDSVDILEALISRNLVDLRLPETAQALLTAACDAGCARAVERLLADSRVDSAAGKDAALRAACRAGALRVVELLLRHPATNPAAADNDALVAACGSGHLPVVERLLADPRVDPAARGNAALHAALRCSRVSTSAKPVSPAEVVRLLLGHPGVAASAGYVLQLRAACFCGALPLLENLLSNEAAVAEFVEATATVCSAALSALSRGHTPLAVRLAADARVGMSSLALSDFADCVAGRLLGTSGETSAFASALRMALATDEAAAVAALLSYPRVDTLSLASSGSGEPAEDCESQFHRLSLVQRLLADERVEPAAWACAAVRRAAAAGDVALLEVLLADERVPSVEGALAEAAKHGRTSAVELLLSHPRGVPEGDGSSDVPNDFALQHACRSGNVAVVEALLADSAIRRRNLMFLRHSDAMRGACSTRCAAIAECLLDEAKPFDGLPFFRFLQSVADWPSPAILLRRLDDVRLWSYALSDAFGRFGLAELFAQHCVAFTPEQLRHFLKLATRDLLQQSWAADLRPVGACCLKLPALSQMAWLRRRAAVLARLTAHPR